MQWKRRVVSGELLRESGKGGIQASEADEGALEHLLDRVGVFYTKEGGTAEATIFRPLPGTRIVFLW